MYDPIEHDGPVWIVEFQIERQPAALKPIPSSPCSHRNCSPTPN
ncbi:hypothetical protein [Thiorhodovibrio litoralis]|nr:hypothetical protein [Thiorhodovibrio litoralis]